LFACSVGVAELLQALFDKIGLIVHFRSFLTRSADNSDGLGPSYKAEGPSMSSNHFVLGIDAAQHGAKASCQYIKYARSGRVADAVRERSLNATPARSISSRSHLSFFVTLTPARWGAYRLASQFSASIGSGGAVLDRTSQNHGQNQQHIENIAQTGSVLWFCDFASRYARRRAYMRTCAYMCARKSRTSEPLQYIVIYHIDIGSGHGSARFWPEPALRAGIESHAFPPVSIKLVGRYVPISACRGLLLGCPGETFGDFGPIGIDRAAAGLDVDQARAIDGFLRVSAGRSGLVGMAMLEWSAQRRRNARYSGNRPLPIGKASACAQVPVGTPPMPPLPATISPSSLARKLCQNLIALRRLNHSGTMRDRQGGARRNGWRQIGSGKGWPVRFDPVDTGRGMQKTAGKLHRITQAIGGGRDVN
jgi:hypothetical protein